MHQRETKGLGLTVDLDGPEGSSGVQSTGRAQMEHPGLEAPPPLVRSN